MYSSQYFLPATVFKVCQQKCYQQRWHLKKMSDLAIEITLPANYIARKLHCPQITLPANYIARKLHCPQKLATLIVDLFYSLISRSCIWPSTNALKVWGYI